MLVGVLDVLVRSLPVKPLGVPGNSQAWQEEQNIKFDTTVSSPGEAVCTAVLYRYSHSPRVIKIGYRVVWVWHFWQFVVVVNSHSLHFIESTSRVPSELHFSSMISLSKHSCLGHEMISHKLQPSLGQTNKANWAHTHSFLSLILCCGKKLFVDPAAVFAWFSE